MALDRRVAVITGSNTGVGLAVAKRLLAQAAGKFQLTIVLACRDMGKAKAAQQEIITEFPGSIVETIKLDTSDLHCVVAAAKEIDQRYGKLDYLYLNAGILPVHQGQFYWSTLMTTNIKHILHVLATSEGLLVQRDWKTDEGFNAVFVTNVVGHFLLIQETEKLLIQSKGRIVWTGSTAANKSSFDLDNIQHEGGLDPYGSSKYALDVVNKALNERLNPWGVYSYTCCPGLVMTGVAFGILPQWLWTIFIIPILMLMRAIEPFYTLSPYNAAEGLVLLSGLNADEEPNLISSKNELVENVTQKHADPYVKYFSRTNVIGRRYVVHKDIDGSIELGRKIYASLEQLTAPYRNKT